MSDDARQTFTLTMDELVRFASEGWMYPLDDSESSRRQVRESIAEIAPNAGRWRGFTTDELDMLETGMGRIHVPPGEALWDEIRAEIERRHKTGCA